jgi:ferric-dicitrate binding protein FerR (iron transport regulator)
MNLTDEKLNEKQLVNKFFTGEVSDNEQQLLINWLAESSNNRKEFDEENEIWQETNFQAKYQQFNAEKGWKIVADKLNLNGQQNVNSKIVVLRRKTFTGMAIAASIAILIALGGLFYLYETTKQTGVLAENNGVTKIQTFGGERATVTLPDSTRVIMNSGSTIKYLNDFNVADRRIWLSGEAYFDVKTDVNKPLQVHLNKITVVATGTKFNIFSHNAERRTEATLEEGNIHVEIPGKDNIYISPGQQVVYFANANNAEVKNVTTESFTSWKENKLRLNDTPIEEALRNIARRYNVTFEIQDPKLLELKYTATFIDESIEEVMQMLKTVSPIRYRIVHQTSVSDKIYVKPKITITSNR